MSNIFNTTIFDMKVSLKVGDENTDVEGICRRLDKEMRQVARKDQRLTYQNVLLIAALNLTERLLAAEQDNKNLLDVIEDGGFEAR